MVYLITDNILFPISLHIFNNLLSMVISYIPNIGTLFDSDISIIILAVLTVISLIRVIEYGNPKKDPMIF